MRVISWNCRRATSGSAVWEHLLEQAPDTALLQEVGSASPALERDYQIVGRNATTKSGNAQRFKTVVLTTGEIVEELTG